MIHVSDQCKRMQARLEDATILEAAQVKFVRREARPEVWYHDLVIPDLLSMLLLMPRNYHTQCGRIHGVTPRSILQVASPR